MSKKFKKERIFNLFLFVEHGLIRELGVTVHEWSGDDMSLLRLLQSKVKKDFPGSRRFPVPAQYSVIHPNGSMENGVLTHELYSSMLYAQKEVAVFEDVFVAVRAPRNPLACITVISGGVPVVDAVLICNQYG